MLGQPVAANCRDPVSTQLILADETTDVLVSFVNIEPKLSFNAAPILSSNIISATSVPQL